MAVCGKKGSTEKRRRAGEELITHRQAGEQQTDATRARLSSEEPGWRERRLGWMEVRRRRREEKRGLLKRKMKARRRIRKELNEAAMKTCSKCG